MRALILGLGMLLLAACAQNVQTAANDPYPLPPDSNNMNHFVVGNTGFPAGGHRIK